MKGCESSKSPHAPRPAGLELLFIQRVGATHEPEGLIFVLPDAFQAETEAPEALLELVCPRLSTQKGHLVPHSPSQAACA